MSTSSFPGFTIPYTTISVDYWPKQENANITHYFLTHCHTDHVKNLDSKWNRSKIYCSKVSTDFIKALISYRVQSSLFYISIYILKIE